MFIRKIVIAAILGAAGIVLFGILVIMLLLPNLVPLNFNIMNTPAPATILLIQGDAERLPAYLSEPLQALNSPVKLDEAPYANCEAVLISREQLFEAGKDQTVRNQLVSFLMNHKILLVYHATTVDIANQLDIDTPTITTQTTYTAVASAALGSNGITSGSLLLSKGQSEENLLQDIRNYVPYFRSAIQRNETPNPYGGDEFNLLTPESYP
jgi:hypothetical protein